MLKPKKIIIVGGVAGGATAAAKARRQDEHAEITLFEKGPYVSFANCGLPYYIAGDIASRENLLLMTPQKFWDKYRIRVFIGHEVTQIIRDQKKLKVKNDQGEEKLVDYDKLILSQGASPLVPPFQGLNQEHVFTLRDVPDMDRIHQFIESRRPKSACVIGGGFIGLEMAEAFHKRGLAVTIIQKAPHLLPLLDNDIAWELEKYVRSHGFELRTGIEAKAFSAAHVLLEDGSRVEADLVLLSVGIKPEIILAKEAGLEIGKTGGIKSNGRMESSDPDIYAVGDAAETTHYLTGSRLRIPLAGPANRQGRVAGANAAGANLTYPGALGTSIVRIMDMTIGYTGLNSRQAQDAGFSFFTSVTRDPSHASYYPGAKGLIIKTIAEEGSGRILGAQVMGEAGVDKRTDVLATAIYARMKVMDLENIDLAYSPPFASANDPVNIAGFVASHETRGEIKTIHALSPELNNTFLLDVREPKEVTQHGMLVGAICIPLNELRDRLHELPLDKKITVYCQKGQRGYVAQRILSQRGFSNTYNLKGGFLEAQANGLPIVVSPKDIKAL